MLEKAGELAVCRNHAGVPAAPRWGQRDAAQRRGIAAQTTCLHVPRRTREAVAQRSTCAAWEGLQAACSLSPCSCHNENLLAPQVPLRHAARRWWRATGPGLPGPRLSPPHTPELAFQHQNPPLNTEKIRIGGKEKSVLPFQDEKVPCKQAILKKQAPARAAVAVVTEARDSAGGPGPGHNGCLLDGAGGQMATQPSLCQRNSVCPKWDKNGHPES